MAAMRIRTGDTVQVVSGKDRGKTGEVLMILADRRDGENFRDNFNLAFFWGDTEQFMRRWASALTEILPAGPKLPKAS